MSDPIVIARSLNYAFGKGQLRKQVLHDIDLEIHAGEIVFMNGPSGSGKTTLLTLLGALRSIQEGRLRVLGHELTRCSEKQLVKVRTQIGYIFQGHNLLRALNARQNVEMALELTHPRARQAVCERAESVLNSVGLASQLHSYPHGMSGGQKQRVAIARAIVNQPQLLLADEPTASLDSKSGRNIVLLLQQLARVQGCAILVVTHDHRIMDIADRTLLMEDGVLVTK
jgi:putative ABC transport system ATP-binding protein